MLSDTMMLGGGRKAAYSIKNSLLFRGGQYLSRTPSVAGNRKVWTWSAWYRIADLAADQYLFTAGSPGMGGTLTGVAYYGSYTQGGFALWWNSASTGAFPAPRFRDPAGFYHLVLVADGTKLALYINGNYLGEKAISGDAEINNLIPHYIGMASDADRHVKGSLSEVFFIDGQALPPTKFGEFDPLTGSWRPKRVQNVDFGTNGFSLGKPWNSTRSVDDLGIDYSGKGNHWTPSGFAVTDVLKDSPTNVYATLNPLNKYSTLSTANGNLSVASGQNGWRSISATLPMSSGKWYWEVIIGTWDVQDEGMIGIVGASANSIAYSTNGFHSADDGYGYYDSSGQKVNSGTLTNYGAAWGVGNAVVGVAFDADNMEIYFSLNGVWQNYSNPVVRTNPAFTVTPGTYFPVLASSKTIGATILNANFGQRAWVHSPPSGFKPLCTANLPTPVSVAAKAPGKYYSCQKIVHNGAGTAVTLGWDAMAADWLVRIKSLGSGDWYYIDTKRGLDKVLVGNSTQAEITNAAMVTNRTASGFVLGSGLAAATYLVEAWRVAPEAGFDIQPYSGTGSAKAVNHNNGTAPGFCVGFNLTNGGSIVYHKSLGATKYLVFNTNQSVFADTTGWNDTEPTATVVTVGNTFQLSQSGASHVLYVWSEVPGFSKFGSHVGNGSQDGPFDWLGFSPGSFVLKRLDASGYGWFNFTGVENSGNPVAKWMIINTTGAEESAYQIDFTAIGAKVRADTTNYNASGGTYITAAWAAHPLGAKRVTPATAR